VDLCANPPVGIWGKQHCRPVAGATAVKGLDWSGVDFTPKSTSYVKKAVELQGSNAAPV